MSKSVYFSNPASMRPLSLVIAMSAISCMSAQAAAPATTTQTLPTIQVSAHPLNRSADDLINPSNIIEPTRLFQQNSSTLAEALDGQRARPQNPHCDA